MFFTEQFIRHSAWLLEFPFCLKPPFVWMSRHELLNTTLLKAIRLPLRELALTHELKQEEAQSVVCSAAMLRGA